LKARFSKTLVAVTCLHLAGALLVAHVLGAQHADVATLVSQLTRSSAWTPVAAIRVDGRVFHPQGMVKVGDDFFVSSVEVTVSPRRFDKTDEAGFDRTPGTGAGHVFRITRTGHIAADLVLGEGTMYHPGGMDFDGRYLWVPVAEYRPDSRSIVYRANPTTMRAEVVLRTADHIGAVAVDSEERILHGASWGSRRFYRWRMPPVESAPASGFAPILPPRDNPSHYVDYQDCKFVGRQRMLCTGLAEFAGDTARPGMPLGGLDLISLADGRPLRQIPVTIRTEAGHVLTRNPSCFEATSDGLLAYFMPDDDQATIVVYRITP
jgi:hypothetical protein